MKHKIFLYGIIFTWFNIYFLNAQTVEDSTVLPKVYLKSASIKGELKNTPAAVNLLDKSEINRSSPTLITGSFNRVPGVYTQEGALNTSRISIRGIGARAQYGTNRIKAYFNEIPITTGDGQSVINDIDLAVIDRVEIIKGPNSSLYGSGLGGVIHLFTVKPEENKSFVKLVTDVGSYQLIKQNVSMGFADENKSFFASYNHLRNEGYRDNSAYDRKSLHINGEVKISNRSHFNFLGNFIQLKAYIPSSISLSDFEENPRQAAFTWQSSQGYEAYDRFLMGLSYSYKFSDKLEQTTSIFAYSRDAYEPRPFDILKQESFNLGTRTRFSYQNKFFQLPFEWSLGGEVFNENYAGSNFENLYESFPDQGSIRGSLINNLEQERNYYNAFTQLKLQVLPKLKVISGFNLNITNYSLTDFFSEDHIDQTGKGDFETIFAPRFAALYKITTHKNIYLNVSKGFSVPTIDETLTPEGRINNHLKPEIGWNYEIGFKGNWATNFYTEIAFYTIQVKDLLVAERVGNDQYVGINAGKTDHNGAEILLRYNWDIYPSINIKPYFSAEFNDYKFDEFIDNGNNYQGNELTGVPSKKINLGFDAILKNNFRFYSNALFVSEIPLNDENSAYSENYKVINLKAAYTFSFLKNFELQLNLGINNLLDEKYAVSILPNAVGFGGNEPRYFYPGNDRNYFGGFALNWFFK